MDLLTLPGIALGLSLDAFTVALASSMAIRDLHAGHGLRTAFFFGLFQALMPVAGWFAGSQVSGYIRDWDHWITFGLLGIIGGRMVWAAAREWREGSDGQGCADTDGRDCRHLPTLLGLSVATSVDALAVGVGFAFIQSSILVPVLLIGVVTFAVCMLAWVLGRVLRHALPLPLEGIGGLVLILIGLRILLDHLLS